MKLEYEALSYAIITLKGMKYHPKLDEVINLLMELRAHIAKTKSR